MKPVRSLECLVLCGWIPVATHAQWDLIASGVSDSLTAVTYDHGRFLTVGGNGAVLTSNNDGISFSTTGNYVPHFYHGGFNHIAFFDSLNGVGSVTLAGDALQRTLDGGATWTSWDLGLAAEPWVQPLNDSDAVLFLAGPGLTFGTDGRFLIEQDFELYANIDSICNEIYTPGSCMEDVVGLDTLIVTGGWGWVRLSGDRCASFDTASFHYAYYVYLCDHVAGDTVAYVDFNRVLHMSHDGGLHWQQPQEVVDMGSLFIDMGFDMLNSSYGLVVGEAGGIWSTDDAGLSWTSTTPVTSQWLRDVHFIDALNAYAVGDGGTILHSVDGGSSWQVEISGTTADLKAIASSPTTVIVVGDEGTILRRDLSVGLGSTATGPSTPMVWPNPFTDELTVDLTRHTGPSPVRFELLDALGRTVLIHRFDGGRRATVSTSDLSPGHYACRWVFADGSAARAALVRQ